MAKNNIMIERKVESCCRSGDGIPFFMEDTALQRSNKTVIKYQGKFGGNKFILSKTLVNRTKRWYSLKECVSG